MLILNEKIHFESLSLMLYVTVVFLLLFLTLNKHFISGYTSKLTGTLNRKVNYRTSQSCMSLSAGSDCINSRNEQDDRSHMEPVTVVNIYVAGLGPIATPSRNDKITEIGLLQKAVINTLRQYSYIDSDGSDIVVSSYCVKEDTLTNECSMLGLHGALGRVALLDVSRLLPKLGISTRDHEPDYLEEIMEEIRISISSYVDEYVNEGVFSQPVLLSLTYNRIKSDEAIDSSGARKLLVNLIVDEVKRYSLCSPIAEDQHEFDPTGAQATFHVSPSTHVKIDGATVEGKWDTSDIYVFDDCINENLRRSLRNVVLKDDGHNWDDSNGPNPSRWERGGLDDVLLESSNAVESDGSCWGLTYDAIEDICFRYHEPIKKFEKQLSEMFPKFKVCKLPESVLGSNVSPITANASTSIDTFNWHIDADPALVPPSPWADIFGRYPNRKQGKPRFLSCLLYINEKWNVDDHGAPTRFLDPPTGQIFDIDPIPGRILMMDQDITHTVVAPKVEAGMKPRYSLVWKLILHPRLPNQDMTLFSSNENNILDTEYVGSASK